MVHVRHSKAGWVGSFKLEYEAVVRVRTHRQLTIDQQMTCTCCKNMRNCQGETIFVSEFLQGLIDHVAMRHDHQ